MTGNDIAAIITAVGFLITALTSAGAFIVSVRNGREVKKVAANVEIIEKATNSMKDALVAATAKASLAEGTAAGLEQGHADGLDQGRKEERPTPATPG